MHAITVHPFSTRYSSFLFLLFTLFQRFYHQMSQQESQCFHGGQVNLARLSFVQLTQKKGKDYI